MAAIVELDDKGRILIPAGIRRRVRSRRFKVTTSGGRVQLEPLVEVTELRGKYRARIKAEWVELEEKGEEYVTKR